MLNNKLFVIEIFNLLYSVIYKSNNYHIRDPTKNVSINKMIM